jgi:hypothetical protein
VVLCDATAGAVTLTLPAAGSNTGRIMIIKRVSTNANSCSVAGVSATDGGTQVLAAPNPSTGQVNVITVVSDGTNWLLLSIR